jgi:hypothetical protein|tara:strand:- start:1826 stop:2020 length:195 start_codon:yes stop_codon:yes gene_type:complete
MKITLDLKYFIIAIASLIIAYMTVAGTIDNYISFAGEANAMGFFLMSALLGVGCLVLSIGSAKK